MHHSMAHSGRCMRVWCAVCGVVILCPVLRACDGTSLCAVYVEKKQTARFAFVVCVCGSSPSIVFSFSSRYAKPAICNTAAGGVWDAPCVFSRKKKKKKKKKKYSALI
eukprot:Opistho-2@55583